MSRTLQSDDPTVISAFHSALLHQLLLLLLVGVAAAVAWYVLRALQYRRAVAGGGAPALPVPPAGAIDPEPLGRHILRLGFGLLWILDGLLQIQSGMVLGLPGTVVEPAAASSPAWVRHLVGTGTTIWSNHPVQAAASAVWIQLGIGVLLLVAPRGRWSRATGMASVGWALVVWVFGEAFGGIFAPGLAWAFGAPGAALLYAAAGGLLALPEATWRGPRLGRLASAGMGTLFLGMAVLQAWPGRGSWQGRTGHSLGPLAAMARTMAGTPQPSLLSGWVSSFASFDVAHGWAVNLCLVVALAAVGAGLCTGRPRAVVAATATAAVLCLATWVLVQDFGFFGGVGTDPNSMLPLLLLVVAGAVALVRPPAPAPATVPAAASDGEWLAGLATAPVHGGEATPAPAPAPAGAGVAAPAGGGRWWERVSPGYAGRVLAAAAAAAVVLVGAVPMAAAAANPHASPILTEAVDGVPVLVDVPAPTFTLTDQDGRPVSLASLRGKVVALTFLDPVCTSDCPIIAQEFRESDAMLGGSPGRVVYVAVVANPIYRSVATVQAFDRQEGLTHLANWLYLTGPVARLRRIWARYGIQVEATPAGSMVAHSELAYVIDGQGRERAVLDCVPGTDSASYSSFSTELTDQIQSVLGA